MNYAVRITRPYDDVQQWVSRVALVCEKMVVYEHNENVSRVHIHAHIWGCAVTRATLCNYLQEALHIDKVNSRDIAFKTQYKPRGSTVKQEIDDGNISYMSKGKYDPKYNKGYSDEEIAKLKEKGFDKKKFEKERKTSDDALWEAYLEYLELEDNGFEKPSITFASLQRQTFAFVTNELGVCLNHNFQNKYNMLMRTFEFRVGTIKEKADDTNSKMWKNWIV